MRPDATREKKRFDPSKVITAVPIAEKSAAPDDLGNNPYRELYDTIKAKPSTESQRATDGSSASGMSLASVTRVTYKPTIREAGPGSKGKNGHHTLDDRSQRDKLSKKEIFFGIWGLLVIIFLLIRAFRWFMA